MKEYSETIGKKIMKNFKIKRRKSYLENMYEKDYTFDFKNFENNPLKKENEKEKNSQKDISISLNKILLNNFEDYNFNNDSDFSYESGNENISSEKEENKYEEITMNINNIDIFSINKKYYLFSKILIFLYFCIIKFNIIYKILD